MTAGKMRTLVVTVLLVAATALGVAANKSEQLEARGPVGTTASMGEDVDVYPYTVHVNDARVATLVTRSTSLEPDPVDTDGVWVVVNLSYVTTRTSSVPSTGFVLRDELGREFPISSRFTSSPWSAGPDIWVRGELAFEVAPDAVGSLELVVDPGRGLYGPMPTRYTVIPLALGGADVLDSTEVITLPEVLAVGER